MILKDIPTELLKDEIKPKIKTLYYKGDLSLLNSPKIAIVGTRKPNQYTKKMVTSLSSKLSSNGITIVSGSALGVDAIAHQYANNNTIAVMANSLDIKYPIFNSKLIRNIYQNSLALSEYQDTTEPTKYSFINRNRIVVALSKILIIAQADLNSGSLRSAEYAIKYNIPIYVLPHQIGESLGTDKLLQDGIAKPIYDIDKFVLKYTNKFNSYKKENIKNYSFLDFCKTSPTYEMALEENAELLFEYELSGKIKILNNRIILI